jgi:serralysin
MPENIRVCIDRMIPEAEGFELAVTRSKKWPNGKRLRVRFLDGSPAVQQKVKQYAEAWHPHSNVTFDFGSSGQAEIRVAFVQDGTSWSAVGTDALNQDWFPSNQPTMNFGWLTETSPEDEYSRVVIHEFGHALGCIHEHQNPSTEIPWNREAVYRYYAARGWSKQVVDHNIFRKYEKDQTQFSQFDRESIMLYAIPAELLTDPSKAVGWNRVLSKTDKEFIKSVYPKSDAEGAVV